MASNRKTCGVVGDEIPPEGQKTKGSRLPIYVQNWVVRAYHGSHKKLQVKKAVEETKREKEDYPLSERNLSCTTRVRRVEIQGNLTFSRSKKAGQIESGGASIGHKVHARRMVSVGVLGVRPNSKAEVRWTRHRGQSHMRAKTTIKDRAS